MKVNNVPIRARGVRSGCYGLVTGRGRNSSEEDGVTSVVRAGAAAGVNVVPVGRAALGTSYLELEPDAVSLLFERLPRTRAVVLLDGPLELRRAQDPWRLREGPALELMRRIKHRFDPAGTCNPGVFVGGI